MMTNHPVVKGLTSEQGAAGPEMRLSQMYLPAPPSMVTVQSPAILVPPMGFMVEVLN